MKYTLFPKEFSREEFELIIEAMAAYQHNHRYKEIYDKLVRQQRFQNIALRYAHQLQES